eukprot:12253128-Alexandrium_andersonii.AAC.1
MSASLVGSEMCIRDRLKAARRAQRRVPCTPLAPAEGPQLDMRRCHAQLGGPWVSAGVVSDLVAYFVGQE